MPRLSLLLPSRERFAGQKLPQAFGKRLARADRTDAAAGESAQLQRHVRAIPAPPAVAAVTRQLDAADAAPHAWLRADPAHVRADISGGRMLACGEMGLTTDECEALIRPLRPLFGDEGMPISAPTPARWYLMLPREAKCPAFDPPADVLGDDLEPHLPQGDAGRRWRRLLNETQVLLHNHPLNEKRIAQGQLPVNSLWFWGGGVLPDFVQVEARMFSDDALVHGLLRIAQAGVQPVPSRFGAALREGDAIFDLRGLRDLSTLANDWLLPAYATMRADDVLSLDFADGAQYVLRRAQRWRFWRRAAGDLA